MMFVECGMVVYEAIDTVWVDSEHTERANGANAFALQLRECMEQLQQKVYAIQEEMEQMSIEETTQHTTLKE